MLKRLTILGGFFIILIVLGQIFLPMVVSQGITQAVKALGGAEKAEVRVEQFPAVWMLTGNFDRVTVKAGPVQMEKAAFEEVDALFEGVKIDLPTLLLDQKLTVESIDKAALRAVVSEQTLAALINEKVKGAEEAHVKITPEKVTAKSTLTLGKFMKAQVVLEGKIIASDNRIVFTTENFNVDNPLLGKLGGAVFTDLVLADFQKLPFDVQVKKVVQEDGKVVIEADNAK